MAKIIKATGEEISIFPANGSYFTLLELSFYLNIQIFEIIRIANGCIMICDEEGKLAANWEINMKATELYREGRMSYLQFREYMKAYCEEGNMALVDVAVGTMECVAGDVLICMPDEII